MDKKEFKVGQQWRRRDGGETTIIKITDHDTFPVQSSHESHTVYGTVWSQGEDDLDLIELIQDVAEPVAHTTAVAGAAPVIPDWAYQEPAKPLVTTQASEPAYASTEIARTIAQFIASKEISQRAILERRDRLQRELLDANNDLLAVNTELEQAKTALAALK